MANYAVVRTDNLFGTDVRANLVSCKYIVTTGSGTDMDPYVKTPTAIENGHVLKLGTLISGEREMFEASAPAANTPIEEIVLIATPEVMYDEHKHSLDDYINEADKPLRGYRLHKGDTFSLTLTALTNGTGKTAPEVGDVIELQADTKMKAVTSATASTTTIGKVHAVETIGKFTYYTVLVG